MNEDFEKSLVDKALQSEAAKQGAHDESAGLLTARDNIFVAGDGTVYGADIAVSDLLKQKPAFLKLVQTKNESASKNSSSDEYRLMTAEQKMRASGREQVEANHRAFHEQFGSNPTSGMTQFLDGVFQPPTKDESDERKIQKWQDQFRK